MLEFNSNHKSMYGSLKKSKAKLKVKNIALAGLTVLSLFLFSGCSKNVECDISEIHAHNYVSSTTFDRYVVSEREHIGEWFRTDEYILIDKQQAEIIEFANDNNLFKISENQDKISNFVSNKSDYVEYRYKYEETEVVTIMNADNSQSYSYIYHDRFSWTSDSSRSGLTGEERNVHHMYYGCKIVTNENGELEVVKSGLVDDLSELSPDFDYILEDFCVKVDALNKNVVLDYEDGPENSYDMELIQNFGNSFQVNFNSKTR